MSWPYRDCIGNSPPPAYVARIASGSLSSTTTTRSVIGPAPSSSGCSTNDKDRSRRLAITRRHQASSSTSTSTSNATSSINEDDYLNEINPGGSLLSNSREKTNYQEHVAADDDHHEADPEADHEVAKIFGYVNDDHNYSHLGDEIARAMSVANKILEPCRRREKRLRIQQQIIASQANSLSEQQQQQQASDAEIDNVVNWLNNYNETRAKNRKQHHPLARRSCKKSTPVPESLLAEAAPRPTLIGGEKKERPYIGGPSVTDAQDDDDEIDYDDSDHDDVVDGNDAGNSSQQHPDSTNDVKYTPETFMTEYRKHFSTPAKKEPNNDNPRIQYAWIAKVRLVEADGNLIEARSLILDGCEMFPKTADIWLEAIRLYQKSVAAAAAAGQRGNRASLESTMKSLMARALRELPRSLKLWTKAVDIESDYEHKRRVFAEARQIIPRKAEIWTKSAELESSPDKARAILNEGLISCPDAPNLLLALAELHL